MFKRIAALAGGAALLVLAGCATYSPMIPTPIGPNGLGIAEQSRYVANGGMVGGAEN